MKKWWQEFLQQPAVAHLLRAVERYNQRGGSHSAAAITYFSVLAVVPMVMVAFSLLGLVLTVAFPELLTALQAWVISALIGYGQLGAALLPVVTSALSNWAAIGLIGLGVATWTGVGWMGNLRRAMHSVMRGDGERVLEKQPYWWEFLADLGALVLLFVSLAATGAALIVSTVTGDEIGRWLGLDGSPSWLATTQIAAVLLGVVMAVGLFWWLLGWFAVAKMEPTVHLIAAVASAVGLIVLQVATNILFGIFSRNSAAALFGPVIVLMLFFNLFATWLILIAAWVGTVEPNAAAAQEASGEPEPTPATAEEPAAMVSQTVAEKSMGVGLVAGYTVGAATGLGIGALIASGMRAVFGKRR